MKKSTRRNPVFFLLLCSDMANRLFGEVVFGPVKSRRLGLSLGINILPADKKICSFNCIYCECGWNTTGNGPLFVPRDVVAQEMETRFSSAASTRESIDVITFAGNGEPTLHPDFAGIIEDTLNLRDKFLPGIPVAVLSNSTMLCNDEVRNALLKCDMPILKLDSALPESIRIINNVPEGFDTGKYFSGLMSMKGRATVQTMFLKGNFNGKDFDNTSETELEALIAMLKRLEPEEVQVYTLHRVPPASGIIAIDHEKLKHIAERLKNESFNVHLVLN
jgi:wyosine [tRNA(Phe)-imidazoG37] synthetase (radical SAM superfamily)